MSSQQDLINKQDEKLGLISSYVSNLKNTADIIGETLDDNIELLDEITIDVENNTESLNRTTDKIQVFLKKVNNNFCMLMLISIFIDVVLMIVYFQI
jgi:hypothetical protein